MPALNEGPMVLILGMLESLIFNSANKLFLNLNGSIFEVLILVAILNYEIAYRNSKQNYAIIVKGCTDILMGCWITGFNVM